MGICAELAVLAVIIVILIDLSGFIQSLEHGLSKWLRIKCHIPRPWSCSFCLYHHISLILTTLTGDINIYVYAMILLISYMTPIIKDILIFLKDMMSQIITILYQIFGI